MISRLLVANRAEIASRVFRTCRALGIETVAVHSDADAGLPYVREADHVVPLPGNEPADTYLRADLLLDAARRSGADAIHPGYGFLSENAGFARAVLDAGLTWVGPDPRSIEQMGSKIEAKRIMAAAGVPVLEVPAEPTETDLPLLVKASAGGGGRGMRIVRTLADLAGEIGKASAEAQSAFGDGTVFVEPYVEQGRHVEVQVLGHRDGVLVLGERDCSIQRRHQKVVEEAPAPRLPDATRAALHEAARAAAAAIDYRGAGTVEFLYDVGKDSFWFLEMNTRLQVEHPVTELVFGVDLVAAQIAVAEGGSPLVEEVGFETGAARLPQPTSPPPSRNPGPVGHAIEVRLYAEDVPADYQPQSGVLTRFEIPEEPGIRVDTGFESGNEVSTHYDAMLAKVIAWAPTREQAARRLSGALAKARIHGVVTNRDLLVRILRSPEFLAGDVSTAFLSRGFETGLRPSSTTDPGAAVAAALALAERTRRTRTVQQGIPVGWRNVTSQPQRTAFVVSTSSTTERTGSIQRSTSSTTERTGSIQRSTSSTTEVVEWFGGRDGYVVDGFVVVAAVSTGSTSEWAVTLEADGVRTTYDVSIAGPDFRAVDVDSPHGHVRLTRVPRFTDPVDTVASGSLLAPMPGTVLSVAVEAGDEVEAGQPVLVLEAMKMQHTVSAPAAGVVTEIDVKAGAQVASGEVLAVVVSTGSTHREEA